MRILQQLPSKLKNFIVLTALVTTSCIAPAPALATASSAVYCYQATNLAMFFYQHLLQQAKPEQVIAYLEVLMENAGEDANLRNIHRHLLFTVLNKKDVVSSQQLRNILINQCTLAYTQETKSY